MAGFWAHGTTVTVDSVAIGGLTGISLPEEARGVVETTDHDSSGDREFVAGLRDGGTITLEGRLLPEDTGQTSLRTQYATNDGSVAEIVITLPDRATATSVIATYTFDGFVTALGGSLPGDSDEPGSFSATLKVSGSVTAAVA